MPYTIRLHPRADEDFIQAYAWYEDKQEGLSEKFIAAVKTRLKTITENPETFGSRDNVYTEKPLLKHFLISLYIKFTGRKVKILSVPFTMAKKHPKKKYRR